MATKKILITMAEYSRRRGCSRPYITKLVQQGVVSLTQGMIDPVSADLQIAAFSAQLHDKGATGQPDDDSLASWRKRELQAKTALRQLQLDEETGKLVNAEELKTVFARLFTDVKTTLRAIPSKAAGELVHLARNAKSDREGMAAVSTLLLKEIDASLTELSQWKGQPKNPKGGKRK